MIMMPYGWTWPSPQVTGHADFWHPTGAGQLQVAGEDLLAGVAAPPGVVHLAVRAEADIGQRQLRPGRPGGVPPQAGARVEPVGRQQPVAVGGDQLDRGGDVASGGRGDEVVEVDPGPAGLDPVAAVPDLLAEGVRAGRADGQQPVPVRAGAGAAAAGLDAEQVIQQRDDEVVVQVPGAVADAEGDDRQPRGGAAAEDLDAGAVLPAVQHVPPQLLFAGGDQVGADRLLEREDQAGPDGFDDGGGAALLARDRVLQIPVADGVDEHHGPAARGGRHRVADQVAAHHQDAGGLRAAGELVRGQEHRVLVIPGTRTGF